jgi:hypothetical protein
LKLINHSLKASNAYNNSRATPTRSRLKTLIQQLIIDLDIYCPDRLYLYYVEMWSGYVLACPFHYCGKKYKIVKSLFLNIVYTIAGEQMPDMTELVHYAIMAPSGHNTQPWKFRIQENIIRIFPDISRKLPVVDPLDRELYISLGCALENLMIAAGHEGYGASVEHSFVDGAISVNIEPANGKANNDSLFNAIPTRQSTRRQYDGKPIPEADMERLASLPLEQGISAFFVTDPEKIEGIIGLVKEGNGIQMNDRDFMQELVSWIRFNEAEANRYRDGLSSKATGNPSSPRVIGKLFMKFFLNAKGQSKKDERYIRSSSALMVVLSENNDMDSWINTGRSFERLALCATALGIKNAHINQPCEVPELKKKLQELLSAGNMHPQLLLRLGYAEPLPGSSKRSVSEVIV